MDGAFSALVSRAADGSVIAVAGAVQIIGASRELHGQSMELRRISIELLVAVVTPLSPPPAPPLRIERVRA